MQKSILFFLFIIFLKCTTLSFAQNNITGKIFFNGFYPFDKPNYQLFENKIDTAANFTFDTGLILAYETYVSRDILSLRLLQGAFFDGAKHLALFTNLSIRIRLFYSRKHSFRIGIGPAVFVRENWNVIENYQQEKWYTKSETKWEQAFSIISGEIEYSYQISKMGDIAISVNHHAPTGFALAFGYRHWFSKKVIHKPCDCPSFH